MSRCRSRQVAICFCVHAGITTPQRAALTGWTFSPTPPAAPLSWAGAPAGGYCWESRLRCWVWCWWRSPASWALEALEASGGRTMHPPQLCLKLFQVQAGTGRRATLNLAASAWPYALADDWTQNDCLMSPSGAAPAAACWARWWVCARRCSTACRE